MKRPVIHIGANKSASTTLQRSIFSKHSGINYLGEDCLDYDKYKSHLHSLVNFDDVLYDHDYCNSLFNCAQQKNNTGVFLYSNEDIMTSFIPNLCAMRLHSILPKAKILLIIRSQYTAIPSFYINHGALLKPAPSEYFRRYVSFDSWMNHQLKVSRFGGLFSFRYDSIINIYESLFGIANIKIMLYEDFVHNKAFFTKQLSDYLDINYDESIKLIQGKHERPGITQRERNLRKIFSKTLRNFGVSWQTENKIIGSFPTNYYIKRGPKARIHLDEYWKNRIFSIYASGNSNIRDRYNLSMENYNYPLLSKS